MIARAVTAIIRAYFPWGHLTGTLGGCGSHTGCSVLLLLPQSPPGYDRPHRATKNHSAANERNIKHLQSDMDRGSQCFIHWETLPRWAFTARNKQPFHTTVSSQKKVLYVSSKIWRRIKLSQESPVMVSKGEWQFLFIFMCVPMLSD